MENYTLKSFSWWNLKISKSWMWILGANFIPNWEKVTSTPGERSGECRFTFLIKFVKLKNSSWVSDAGSFCWLEIPCKFSKGSCPLEDKFEFWPFLLLFLTFLGPSLLVSSSELELELSSLSEEDSEVVWWGLELLFVFPPPEKKEKF